MSTKKTKWFERHKTFFIIPMRPAGWTVIVLYVTLNAIYFVQVDKSSHSVSDTLLGFFWFFIVSTLILYLIVINKE